MQPSNEQTQGFKVRAVANQQVIGNQPIPQSVPRSESQIAVTSEFLCSNTANRGRRSFPSKKAGPTGVRPAFVRDTAQGAIT